MLKTAPPGPVRQVSRASRTLADLFRRRCEASGPYPALYRKEAGEWRGHTWSDFYDMAARAARGIVEGGVEVGERVAILGPTQVPWCVYDMAAQLAGAVSFGIYPMQTPEQIRYLLTHSEARLIFVDTAAVTGGHQRRRVAADREHESGEHEKSSAGHGSPRG